MALLNRFCARPPLGGRANIGLSCMGLFIDATIIVDPWPQANGTPKCVETSGRIELLMIELTADGSPDIRIALRTSERK